MKMRNKYVNYAFLLFLIVLNAPWLYGQSSYSYSLLFTGNTAEGIPDKKLLNEWQKASAGSDSLAYLMLGNNYNLNENKFPDFLFDDKKHPLLLVPGKKEWANGNSSGKELIQEIEKSLSKKYKGNVYWPDAACPGPREVVLNEHVVVILIDSYWWVHKHDRRFNKCGIESNTEVLVEIEDAIRRHYPSKHVLIAAHHSLKSYGNSDGYFSIQQSILEAPYALYRRILGERDDNHHPDFKGFRNAMLSISQKYPDIIYVSAADENLQYFNEKGVHHVVSGSFTQTAYVQSNPIEFGKEAKGFGRLNFSNDGDCELLFTGTEGELFRKKIYHRSFVKAAKHIQKHEQLFDSITINASDKYNISEKNYIWMGKNYRQVWSTPIKVPVFDIDNKKGGLKLIKRGGGMQTLSLRLEDKSGKQYVLRTLDKNVEGALPVDLKNTLAVDIIQDQISASNPYAALVVAQLAESAGIYHTNPEIVYVPDDIRFGIYQKDVANKLFLFEEYVGGDRSDIDSFGNSKNIISTDEVIEHILDDEDYSIDKEAVVRARLFDILLNDWDRHDDQWRWATFKAKDKTLYKPIPRDRDQAFFVNEGLFPILASRKWIMPKFQGFDEYTENVDAQYAYRTRYFDQTFLSYQDWNAWQAQLDTLRRLLTREKIEKAVLSFPKEVQAYCANHTAATLIARLNNLEAMARQLYLSLAKEVEITATNRRDLFEITIPNDTTIRIQGYHLKDKETKGSAFYDRTFYASETEQIRIYGFDKNDRFLISGSHKNKIKLLIIGGDKNDELFYDGTARLNFLHIYGNKNEDLAPSIKKQVDNKYDKNELKYNRETYKYDVVFPALFLGYNRDDGLFLGGGADVNKYSRFLYKNYKIMGNYGFTTDAINFHFEGNRLNLLKRLEYSIVADYKSPSYVFNYFGMGNETAWLVDKSEKEYYRLRMGQVYFKVEFAKKLDENGVHKAGLGFTYKKSDLEATEDRFISDFTINDLRAEDLSDQNYGVFSFKYELNTMLDLEQKKESDFIGSQMFPIRGMQLKTEVSQFFGMNEYSPDFTKLSGEWTSYFSFSQRPRVVYSLRLGGEKIFGDYVFNEAAKLGQNANLRGYRLTRFYGDASVYLNTEIRVRAKQFNTYLLNGTAGLLLFNDIGRVWLEGEKSTQWHDGYGVGFWMSPFDMATITISYAGSTEDNLINFNFKYQF